MADDLVTVLARAFKKHRIDSEIRALQDEVDGREPYDGFTDEEFAQAALDALKAEGWMLVRWESWTKERDAELAYVEDMGFLAGLEPPAAAITAALKETFKPNPSDNDKPPHNRGP